MTTETVPDNGGGVVMEAAANKDALGLVERLDPAIGEVTSVAGAVLSELLRRTLRGGVMRIGDEMHDFVSQKVDTVVAEKAPAIEQMAAEAAEHTARAAATEVATTEVRALEQRTRDAARELAAHIEATARAADDKTTQSAAVLAAQIEQAEQRARDALVRTEQAVQQQTTQTAEALTVKIEEADKQARAAHEEAQRFAERAREGTARFKAKLAELESTMTRQLEENQSRLREELRALTRSNDALAARVAELEKPRGLRALFAWLFGRRKPKATTSAPTSETAQAVDV
jgi:hypothetical protein